MSINEAANALMAADGGDYSLLIARIADRNINLTDIERSFIIAKLQPAKKGRNRLSDEIEVYHWHRKVHDMSHKDAVTETARIVKGNVEPHTCEAIQKLISRRGGQDADLGPEFNRRVEWYRQGSRSPSILPRAMQDARHSFERFLSNTE